MQALIPERPGSARESAGPGVQDVRPDGKTSQVIKIQQEKQSLSVLKKPIENRLYELRSGW